MSSVESPAPEVILETKNTTGIITLNRPKALNALNLNMVRLIQPQMDEWKAEGAKLIVIKGMNGRNGSLSKAIPYSYVCNRTGGGGLKVRLLYVKDSVSIRSIWDEGASVGWLSWEGWAFLSPTVFVYLAFPCMIIF